jgi:hypothetical protein
MEPAEGTELSRKYEMVMLKVSEFVQASRRFLMVAYKYEEARHLDKSDPDRVLLGDEYREKRGEALRSLLAMDDALDGYPPPRPSLLAKVLRETWDHYRYFFGFKKDGNVKNDPS